MLNGHQPLMNNSTVSRGRLLPSQSTKGGQRTRPVGLRRKRRPGCAWQTQILQASLRPEKKNPRPYVGYFGTSHVQHMHMHVRRYHPPTPCSDVRIVCVVMWWPGLFRQTSRHNAASQRAADDRRIRINPLQQVIRPQRAAQNGQISMEKAPGWVWHLASPLPYPHQALMGIVLHTSYRTQRRGGCAIAIDIARKTLLSVSKS